MLISVNIINVKVREIIRQLRQHAPYTAIGTASGILIMLLFIAGDIPRSVSEGFFWILHPGHVVLSAMVTTAMYRQHSRQSLWRTVLVGYFGSIGIATLSDSLIPYAGEFIMQFPHREAHLGFIEKWWLVNPLAFAGITIGWFWPRTRIPHAGHVFLSTWASMFHLVMAMGTAVGLHTVLLSTLFLFIAVWLPCCTSDIVFPLLFAKGNGSTSETHGSCANF